jgi:hypothetical protein
MPSPAPQGRQQPVSVQCKFAHTVAHCSQAWCHVCPPRRRKRAILYLCASPAAHGYHSLAKALPTQQVSPGLLPHAQLHPKAREHK